MEFWLNAICVVFAAIIIFLEMKERSEEPLVLPRDIKIVAKPYPTNIH
jgi:hypothetical protein